MVLKWATFVEFLLTFVILRAFVFPLGQNGKYWRLEGDGISVDGEAPRDGFYLELREPTRICIR